MDHQLPVSGSEVFVGGLSRSIAEDTINEVFSTCGEVLEVRLIKDNAGTSKGFGFVRFATKEAADKALKEKSGITLDGKKIGVLPSNEQKSLYFGKIRKEWTDDEFEEIIRQDFPDVVSVELPKPFRTEEAAQKQQNRGFALVKFSSHLAAVKAHRVATKSDFSIAAGSCHPVVKWAEDTNVDPEELAKVKTAFVSNLPYDADEKYLRELFEPLGKLELVSISNRRDFPVGYVQFLERTDLDNAIKEMNGKEVQCPNEGPLFKLQVELARPPPVEKKGKRSRDDSEKKTAKKIPSQLKSSTYNQILDSSLSNISRTQELHYLRKEAEVTDTYDAVIASLPFSVKERFLRILRLGIATKYDLDVRSLTSLRQLPQQIAVTVLDQFMLSGADKSNKGEYLARLIAQYPSVDKHSMNLPRTGDYVINEVQLPGYSSRHHLPATDTSFSRYDSSTGRYSSVYSQPHPIQSSYGTRIEEDAVSASFYQSPGSSSVSYNKLVLDPSLQPTIIGGNPSQPQPPPPPRVRFDPFTGIPYKFDPFTGEPLLPQNSPSLGFRSPY